jgi:hypothetical protein
MSDSQWSYDEMPVESRVVDLLPRVDGELDDAVRVTGVLFRLLSDAGKLTRFDAEWDKDRDLTIGVGNCHILARVLCEELQAQGLPAKWVCATIQADYPRRALDHSWVEVNGVAIEMSDSEIHIGLAAELRELSAATDVVDHACNAKEAYGSIRPESRSEPPPPDGVVKVSH